MAIALNSLVNQRRYATSKLVETVEYVGLAVIAVLVPLLLQQPQLAVGAAVNFVLIMAAVNVKGWSKLISLIVLPSVAALAGTVLFGPFKIFLVYMLPFIWVGNAVLVFVFKYLFVGRKINFAVVLPIAAIVKTGAIFAAAMLLIKASAISSAAAPVFANAMGMVQLETALMGGIAALGANLIYKKIFG